MGRLRVFVVLLLCLPATSFGAERRIPVEKAVAVLKTYANTIGCEVHINKSNFVAFDIERERVVVGLYSIDEGCTGGSTMTRPAFAILKYDVRDKLLVNPGYSLPSATSQEFPRFIDRLFLKDNQLWYSGKDFDWSKDALCCPSVPIKAQVLFQGGKWIDSRKRDSWPQN